MKECLYEVPLIHHSERGIQYCSHPYTDRLREAGVAISMTYSGNAENAIAERVNGILKTEYLLDATFESQEAALKEVRQAVHLHNEERPHMNIEMLTPCQAHRGEGKLKRLWSSRRKSAA